MGYLKLSKILLILILPLLFFLIASNYAGFDDSFYKEKFSEFNVWQKVPNAYILHQKVINFLQGRTSDLPNEFNDREKQHLADVREVVSISRLLLLILIVIFSILLLTFASKMRKNNFRNFIGKVLALGGLLTLLIAAALFFLINSSFSSAFQSFHRLFFRSGTYLFDPSSEMIINLYPEPLFMDLGIKISLYVVVLGIAAMLTGIFLACKNKKNK